MQSAEFAAAAVADVNENTRCYAADTELAGVAAEIASGSVGADAAAAECTRTACGAEGMSVAAAGRTAAVAGAPAGDDCERDRSNVHLTLRNATQTEDVAAATTRNAVVTADQHSASAQQSPHSRNHKCPQNLHSRD